MTTIVWNDGAVEAVADALVPALLADGARIAAAIEEEEYAAWLEWCDAGEAR